MSLNFFKTVCAVSIEWATASYTLAWWLLMDGVHHKLFLAEVDRTIPPERTISVQVTFDRLRVLGANNPTLFLAYYCAGVFR